jgi:molybdenum cofactor cytidylyltransferase
MKVAAVLLAAGRSTRFGQANKIAADLAGLPLGLYAARALAALPLDARYVVTATDAIDWPGFSPIRNDRPEEGMARSIALGVAAARAGGATAILIALADMPFVPPAHYARLLALHRGADTLVASGDGTRRMPPALFGQDWLPMLEALTGDAGARSLLDRAELVPAPPDWLADVDLPSDLDDARRRAGDV